MLRLLAFGEKNISLSIVLPTFNEEENIDRTVSSAINYSENNIGGYEVIVVNHGSQDRTGEIGKRLASETT